MAKTTGRIDTIFVSEKQLVKKGDFIAVIENPARLEDIMQITNYELQITGGDSLSAFCLLPASATSNPPTNNSSNPTKITNTSLPPTITIKKLLPLKNRFRLKTSFYQNQKSN
jgi:hypothetical protein